MVAGKCLLESLGKICEEVGFQHIAIRPSGKGFLNVIWICMDG